MRRFLLWVHINSIVYALVAGSSTYDSFLNDITPEEFRSLRENVTHQGLLQATQRPDYDTTQGPSQTHPDWMDKISDTTRVTSLSIPGTHNSMSLFGGPWAECQTWKLDKMYLAGVRYVDIRCRHFNDVLPIHHGIMFQNRGFEHVLQDTVKFLDEHPTETVLMRVKEEYKAENNSKRFEDVVNAHLLTHVPSHRIWTQSNIPTLGEVRGKIIVLRDFIDWRWTHYRLLSIADDYDVPSLFHIGKKWDSAREQLEKAKLGSEYQGYLSYTSGSSAFAFPSSVASRVNEKLLDFLKDRPGKARWGIIAMDFPGVGIIDRIIKSNFDLV